MIAVDTNVLRRYFRGVITDRRAAPIADCLIAQACIDADVPLVTDDGGFTRYVEFGLKLL